MSSDCELLRGENSVIEINGSFPHFAYHRYFPWSPYNGILLRIYKYVPSINKVNTQVYAENISFYYGRCHYEYFNFVDFQYKQFIVSKI
jgi:hypothetical protein